MQPQLFEDEIEIQTGRYGPIGGAWVIGQGDFNGDGRIDVVIGFYNDETDDQMPLQIMLNNGNGTFTSGFETTLLAFDAIGPLVEIADFNGDGYDDIFMIDQFSKYGQVAGGGFPANEPSLLLSDGQGGYTLDTTIGDKYFALDRWSANQEGTEQGIVNSRTVYSKTLTSADIDNDGDLDIFVESGGGWPWTEHHFLINDGTGNFTISYNERLVREEVQHPDSDYSRFEANTFADMNGDGFLDIIMGSLKNRNNGQDNDTAIIVFNDGNGFFPSSSLLRLPVADYNDGYVSTPSLDAVDIDGDGDNDLILHLVATDTYAGRYTQILINDNGTFVDETATRFDNHADLTSPDATDIFGTGNYNSPGQGTSTLFDFNNDGHMDMFMEVRRGVSDNNPIVFLNDGEGYFTELDISAFPENVRNWAGQAITKPFDATGDGIADLVSMNGWGEANTVLRIWAGIEQISTGPGGMNPASLGAAGFNEHYYLRTNIDAAAGVEAGTFESGLAHYIAIGMPSNRMIFAANTTVWGHENSDTIVLREGNETAFGLDGDDILSGGEGGDTLDGGAGIDTADYSRFAGQTGIELSLIAGSAIDGFGDTDTLISVENVIGSDFADSLIGDDGSNEMYGLDGNDQIDGGAGGDTIEGGAGHDLIFGGNQNDNLFGGDGNDQLLGQRGADFLYGGAGDDLLLGGNRNDRLFGEDGNDRVFGGNDQDVVSGGAGRDIVRGGNGDDDISGDAGNDVMFGGTGRDTVDGGEGDDFLFGRGGFDVLIGGTGDDTLEGGLQADQFIFADGFGNDVITDFSATANGEKIHLTDVTEITDFQDLIDNHMSQVGADVVIADGLGNTITLLGVQLSDLDAVDFVF